ncbi:MAG: septum formation protein [Myxococcota bacterium]
MRTLLLASTSQWRRQMLRSAGVQAVGIAPGVTEESTVADPVARAIELAQRKAHAVFATHPDALVIGADQVVTDGAEIWGKPRGDSDHLARLQRMRGVSHDLVTGWCVLSADGETTGHASTTMHVRSDLTNEELEAYVASGEGSGCAGGYAAEAQGGFLFERVDGDWNNVIGLPLFQLLTVLRAHGWRYTARV